MSLHDERVGLSPETQSVLLRSGLLRGLPPAVVDALLREAVVEHVPAGASLFSPTETGARLWFVLTGRVGVTTPDGVHLLAVLDPGSSLGEVQVFDPEPWTFAAFAMTDAEVASVPRDDVLDWAGSHPEVSVRLLQRLARRVAEKSRAGREPAHGDASVRLARALLDLADRYTVEGVVRHGLTQQQLADIVGLSRERVNKTLGEFCDRGWLALARGALTVLDRPALEARAVRSGPSEGDAP